MDPLEHFLKSGIYEGRAAMNEQDLRMRDPGAEHCSRVHPDAAHPPVSPEWVEGSTPTPSRLKLQPTAVVGRWLPN